MAWLAICWNCWVSAPQNCIGSGAAAADAAFAPGVARGLRGAAALAAAGSAAAAGLKAWARSGGLKFMPLSVARVSFCTSSAWMVALSAVAFWSSQNCTALSSSMRLSSAFGSSVGATH